MGKFFPRRIGATAWLVAPMFVAAAAAPGADGNTVPQKAQLCVVCHGPDGHSANPQVPSLAGQPKQFITTQLVMFRAGNRKDPQMSPLAATLSNPEINDLGTYFSAQKPAVPALGTAAEKTAAGQRLTEKFNCVQCHGSALTGQQHIPRLAGQQREYLKAQLRGFKAGTRFDMDGDMTSAAQPLSDADIETLAEYLAGLQ